AAPPTQRIRRMAEGDGRRRGGEAVEAARRAVTWHLHTRVRVVPVLVMHIMQGRAHGLSSPRPLKPRGLRSPRLFPPRRRCGWIGSFGPERACIRSITGLHSAWWDSSISTCAGPSWEIPFMAPASVPTPPMSPAPVEHPDQPPARGRGRRVPRR
ncbi:hypothetical protein PIB30_104295, partial [Stylosanthes scabra]|nr:hypothetical protein [Stylosanthes scabra]